MSSGAWPAASAPRPVLLIAAIAAIATLAGLLAAPVAVAQRSMPALMSPQAVVGPSSAIDSLNGLSVARDGSGGMVFLETVGGVPRVFVSRLVQGAWQAPEQIDAGLSGPSSQPQIAADNNGELLVAFVNSNTLYVTGATNSTQPFSAPGAISTGASNPSLSINSFGVAYLAFTAQDGAGHDVDVDYFNGSSWAAASPQAFNVNPGDDAGTGAGAPEVIAAGDGVGIVTWGENGHVYVRRVWGTGTSVATARLDPSSVGGWSEVTADNPEISAGGDSSYPDIAFREQVTSGGKTQSRVLVARLIAENTESAVPVDALGAGSEGASQPQLAMNEYGQGFVTAATTSSHQLIDTPLFTSGVLGTPTVLAPGGDTALPDAVTANAGLVSNLIAWQQTPSSGAAQVLVSYAPNGTDLSVPLVVSTAANGPTDAAKGLFAAGDRNGDAVIVWVQGQPGALSIDAAEMVTAPGAAGGQKKVVYTKSNAPLLAWTAARESWGAVAYTVVLDGSSIGQTSNVGWQLPGPLTDGPHPYEVTVTNQASESSTTVTRTIFVDTYPPVVKTKPASKLRAGEALTLTLRYADPPNPAEPGSKASGVASETVNWGDRTAVVTGKKLLRPRHVYRRRGRYTVTVTVTDRAGNATTSTRALVIKAQQKPRSTRTPKRTPRRMMALAARGPAGADAAFQRSVAAPTSAAPPTKGALMSDGPANRYQLGGTWLYRPDPTNTGVASGWWQYSTDTTDWNPVTMPDSFNAGSLTNASYNGSIGWYRRDFTVPVGAFPSYVPQSAQRWVLQFESVNYTASVWLNGHKLGIHKGAYLPFEFTMKYLQTGVNQLVVRVDDRLSGGTFPHSTLGWWNYGGILDAVYMRPVSGSEIDNVQIRTTLTCPTCSATIDEQATVRNLSGSTELVSLTGHYGTAKLVFGSAKIRPGATWTPSASVVVTSPQLWAPGSPYLYRATFNLADSHGRRIGGYTYQSGIRQITLTGGQVYLNGRPLHLMGVNLHEQAVQNGAALTLAQERRFISWVQQLGGTIIRAHYPLDPELEQLADRAGILLWSEVPVYQAGASYQANASWRRQATALVDANIEANQNHPSILVWSIGNELGSPPSAGQAAYVRQAAAAAKKLDPTRPVGMAVTDWPGLGCQSAYAPLQVIGVNEYFGWFDAGGTNEDRDGLASFMQSVRACYPNQGIFVSEWGFGANRDGPVEVRGTYRYQVNSIQYAVGTFNTLPWLSGAIYFPIQDFAARPGWDGQDPLGTPPWVDKGVLDQYGNPKPSFAVMASLYQGSQQIGPPSLTALRVSPRPARR